MGNIEHDTILIGIDGRRAAAILPSCKIPVVLYYLRMQNILRMLSYHHHNDNQVLSIHWKTAVRLGPATKPPNLELPQYISECKSSIQGGIWLEGLFHFIFSLLVNTHGFITLVVKLEFGWKTTVRLNHLPGIEGHGITCIIWKIYMKCLGFSFILNMFLSGGAWPRQGKRGIYIYIYSMGVLFSTARTLLSGEIVQRSV